MAESSEDEKQIRHLLTLDKKLPAPPHDLARITKLDFFGCDLSELPQSLSQVLPNLSILFCMKNSFTEVPAVVGNCPKLQMISFKSNHAGPLTKIHPNALQAQLRWLILTDNKITHIPSTIGNCINLQKCMFSGNALQRIPDEVSNCTNLELIRLASNQLTEAPTRLLELPKLAWVAFSNNPFLKRNETADSLPPLKILDDPALEDPSIGKVLGKGASGVTHEKVLDGKTVAVKTYVGKMTSDGDPAEERKISLVASSLESSALIQVVGQTLNKGALVMEYLHEYEAIAGPPSLESCSRDVYPEGLTLSPSQAIAHVTGLVEALSKLHAAGICHGDFYGHNILVPSSTNTGGGVKLSDFGAAFLYDPEVAYGKLIQRAEQRALGIFAAEIAKLVSNKRKIDSDEATKEKLVAFSQICLDDSNGLTMGMLDEKLRAMS